MKTENVSFDKYHSNNCNRHEPLMDANIYGGKYGEKADVHIVT